MTTQVYSPELFDFILRGLEGTPAHNLWKDPMVIPTKLILRSELFQEGGTKRQAQLVLRLLDLNKIEISPAQREQIASCTDLDLLNSWFDAAAAATSISDLTGLAA